MCGRDAQTPLARAPQPRHNKRCTTTNQRQITIEVPQLSGINSDTAQHQHAHQHTMGDHAPTDLLGFGLNFS